MSSTEVVTTTPTLPDAWERAELEAREQERGEGRIAARAAVILLVLAGLAVLRTVLL